MIAAEDLPGYLSGHGLFDAECAVEGSLSIVPGIGRIGGLRLIRSPGDSYFVKQAADERNLKMLHREAEVYHWLLSHSADQLPLVPHCYGFDPEHGALILELDPQALSFHEYCRDRKGGDPAAAARAALSVARLHRLRWTLPPSPHPHENSLATWVLNLPELDLADYLSLSSGSLQCVRLLQSEEDLCLRLHELAKAWRIETPIHGDLRFSNMLYHPSAGNQENRVSLIDWELARPGDPCWDIGSILANYFTCWIQSIPPGEGGPDTAHAAVPVRVVQAATQSFWLTYANSMNLNAEEARERLIRSMQYAATRLIQYVIEMTSETAAASAHNVLMLQLAENILDRPAQSLRSLCGLPIQS